MLLEVSPIDQRGTPHCGGVPCALLRETTHAVAENGVTFWTARC